MEKHLAPRLEDRAAWNRRGQRFGRLACRPDIGRNVVAAPPVAARGGVGQTPILVAQRHGDAIDLQFDDVFHRAGFRQAGQPPDSFVELADFLRRIGVGDRKHRHGMLDRGEAFGRPLANGSRRRVRAGQLGMARFEIAQFGHERIVLAVGYFRLSLLIIQIVMPFDLAAQLVDSFGWRLRHLPCSSPAARGAKTTTNPRCGRPIPGARRPGAGAFRRQGRRIRRRRCDCSFHRDRAPGRTARPSALDWRCIYSAGR
ncbi:MAG: hypothetical protein BWZ10_02374 [candidate division BRC1 bacterium ADurb.BinA364]|nr:MAG: hypothetical protein BWZ10_02374 [candidate division BRC1 bacterium ADurb.BinA364]